MKNRNSIAVEYLFMRNPAPYALTIISLGAALITYFSTSKASVITDGLYNSVHAMFEAEIVSYLLTVKTIFCLFSSFFLTYRWSIMEKNRNYGYWLTQGIDRQKFFVKASIVFIGLLTATTLVGLVYLEIYSGFILGFTNLLLLSLIILFSSITIISLAILMGELINNPEIAFILFGVVYFILLSIRDTFSSQIGLFFFPELNYFNMSYISLVWHSILAGGILYFVSLRLHLRKDIEL